DVFLIQQNDADTTGRPAFSARASPGRLCRKRDHLFVESMGDTPQADAAGEPSRDLFDDARLGGLNLQSRAERKRVTVGRDASSERRERSSTSKTSKGRTEFAIAASRRR